MPNEVQIVVKSIDNTDFSKFGAKARTAMHDSMKAGLDDVEKLTQERFDKIGETSGKQFGTSLRTGATQGMGDVGKDLNKAVRSSAKDLGADVRTQLKDAGEKAGGDFGSTFTSVAKSRIQKMRGEVDTEFKKIGESGGAALGAGFSKTILITAKSVGDSVSRSVKDSVDGVDDGPIRAKFTDIGHRAGADFSAALDAHLATWSKHFGGGGGGGGFGRDIEKGFSLATKAGLAFGKGMGMLGEQAQKLEGMWRLLPSAILVGLQLLPVAASAVGGAMALALGGAFAFIGLKAQASNEDVRNAFTDTRAHVVSETKQMTEPFHDTLLHMSADATHAFDSIEPSVNRTFAKIAPSLTKFSGQFANSFSRLNPMIDSIGTAFDRVLGALGPRMGAIMNNLGTGIKAVMDGVSKNPKGFVQIIEFSSQVVRGVGDVIGILAKFSTQINTASAVANAFALGPIGDMALGMYKLRNAFSGGGGKMAGEFIDFSGAAKGASGAMSDTGMATQHLLSSQKAATMTTDQLKAALDRLTGANQTQFDAQTTYANALNAANAQAKKSNAGFDGNSKAIQDNRAALSQLSQAFKSDLTGKTPQQIANMRKAFISAAEGMGASKQRAKELANELLGVSGSMKKIPDKKVTKLEAKDNTKGATNSANKGLAGFAHRVYRAQLTATSKVSGAVKSAMSSAQGFARRVYRAQLTAQSKVSGIVRSAISSCNGFAKRAYRAQLTATNRAGAALASALRDGYNWARRNFTATFSVRKVLDFVNPFKATGGIIGGLATGGVPRGQAGGGPGGSMTWVGEQGPELVRLPTGSQVYPAGQSKGMAAQAGGGPVDVRLEVVGGDTELQQLLVQLIRRFVQVTAGRGPGNVQKAFG